MSAGKEKEAEWAGLGKVPGSGVYLATGYSVCSTNRDLTNLRSLVQQMQRKAVSLFGEGRLRSASLGSSARSFHPLACCHLSARGCIRSVTVFVAGGRGKNGTHPVFPLQREEKLFQNPLANFLLYRKGQSLPDG